MGIRSRIAKLTKALFRNRLRATGSEPEPKAVHVNKYRYGLHKEVRQLYREIRRLGFTDGIWETFKSLSYEDRVAIIERLDSNRYTQYKARSYRDARNAVGPDAQKYLATGPGGKKDSNA